MANHLFKVGAIVSLDFPIGTPPSTAEPFTVEAQMPPLGTSLQYRVRAKSEAFGRVVTEEQITLFGAQPRTVKANVAAPHAGEED